MNEVSRAARESDLKTLNRCSRKQVNRRDDQGMTPVHWAAAFGNIEALRIIVGKGGNPDKPNQEGRTSLHLAASAGQLHCLVFLTNFGGNVYAVDDRGEAPIQSAANKGRITCVRHLETIVTHQIAQDRDKVNRIQAKAKIEAEKRVREKTKLMKKLDKDFERKRDSNTKDFNNSIYEEIRKDSEHQQRTTERRRKLNFSQLLGMDGVEESDVISDVRHDVINDDDKTRHHRREDELILSELSEDVMFENSRLERSSIDTQETGTTNVANSKHSSSNKHLPTPNISASINSLHSNVFIRNHQALSDSLDEADMGLMDHTHLSYSDNSPSSQKRASSRLPDDKNDQHQEIIVQNVTNLPPSKRRGRSPVARADVHLGPLYTLLHVLDLDDLRETFRREKIDLRAFLLCDENDLKEMGLALGQRKIILDAINRRKLVTKNVGEHLTNSTV